MLADLASFAAGRVTEAQLRSDTEVRISRVIRGSVSEQSYARLEREVLGQPTG